MRKFRKDQKGFTLVELIVVLVILAILAAMLVPALLGYIDRARAGKYNEEVHSIYTAAQVVADEAYANNTSATSVATYVSGHLNTGGGINSMVDPTSVTSISIGTKGTSGHDAFTINALEVTFSSQDGTAQNAKMDSDGTITVWQ